MWWWVWAGVLVVLLVAYVTLLAARVGRLHQRAASAAAALDAALVRRAAAAAVLAEELREDAPAPAADLYATAHAALDAGPADREVAENDLTLLLRKVPTLMSDRLASSTATPDRLASSTATPDRLASSAATPDRLASGAAATPDRLASSADLASERAPAWPAVVTASRRAGLARQVHTDAVRDALTLRRRRLVRGLGLTRRHGEPAYFDVGDPELDGER